MAADRDVLDDGKSREPSHLLEVARNSHRRHEVRARAPIVTPLERDLTGGRTQHSADDIEQRGLAGAVRADQRMDPVLRDLARDVVEREISAEPLADALDLE